MCSMACTMLCCSTSLQLSMHRAQYTGCRVRVLHILHKVLHCVRFLDRTACQDASEILTWAMFVSAGKYVEGKKPWSASTKYDIALPCATQNEIGKEDAEALVKAGVKMVAEGANMPTESDAIAVFHKNNVVYAPGKVSSC